MTFLEDHLHAYIGIPYRENGNAEMAFMASPDHPETFEVLDKLTWTLRTVGGSHEEKIGFVLDRGEALEAPRITLVLTLPDGHENAGKEILRVDSEVAKPSQSGGYEFWKDLSAVELRIDRLLVTIEARYSSSINSFRNWWLLAPMRDFTLTITYPDSHEIQFQDFVHAPNLTQWTRRRGYLRLRYPSWVLPGNGFAWNLAPSQQERHVASPTTKT